MNIDDVKSMSDEELRVKVAEFHGWKCYTEQIKPAGDYKPEGYTRRILVLMDGGNFPPDVEPTTETPILSSDPLPDYSNDINAAHEAAMKLGEREREVFADALAHVLGTYIADYARPNADDYIDWIENPAGAAFDYANATARHRCEALVLTLSKQ